MKTWCVESIIGLRFKLQMFGIPFHTPTDNLCGNQDVVNNSSKLESKLNKKHSSLGYHATWWALATGIVGVGKISGGRKSCWCITKKIISSKT